MAWLEEYPERSVAAKLPPPFSPSLGALLAASLTPEQTTVIQHISADSLRGHLSFVASDLLEGRATPFARLGRPLLPLNISPHNSASGGSGASWGHRLFSDRQSSQCGAERRRSKCGRIPTRLRPSACEHVRNPQRALRSHWSCDPMAKTKSTTGANDDGSGTVSVIEIASALRRPRRGASQTASNCLCSSRFTARRRACGARRITTSITRWSR